MCVGWLSARVIIPHVIAAGQSLVHVQVAVTFKRTVHSSAEDHFMFCSFEKKKI